MFKFQSGIDLSFHISRCHTNRGNTLFVEGVATFELLRPTCTVSTICMFSVFVYLKQYITLSIIWGGGLGFVRACSFLCACVYILPITTI